MRELRPKLEAKRIIVTPYCLHGSTSDVDDDLFQLTAIPNRRSNSPSITIGEVDDRHKLKNAVFRVVTMSG